MNETDITKPTVAEEDQIQLSAEEIKFTNLVSKGYSYTSAYRKAFPTASELSNYTVRHKASQLATKQHIITEVATKRETSARLARLAEDRIEEVLTEGDIHARGSRVPDVAMFMYDHANGKATIKAEVKSAHVQVIYDLSGGQAGEVPQDILDQLAQAQ